LRKRGGGDRRENSGVKKGRWMGKEIPARKMEEGLASVSGGAAYAQVMHRRRGEGKGGSQYSGEVGRGVGPEISRFCRMALLKGGFRFGVKKNTMRWEGNRLSS